MDHDYELEDEYARRLASWTAGRPVPEALEQTRWLLEEFRVARRPRQESNLRHRA